MTQHWVVTQGWRRTVPWMMVWLRVVLGPVIVLGAHRGWDGRWLGLIVLVALLDDIFDGVLARRWGTATPGLRLADSCADTVFYLGVVAALWLREPRVLTESWRLLAVLFTLEGVRYAFDLWRFRRAAAYHSYLAKFWALVLSVAVISALSVGGAVALVRLAIVLGIAANLEGLAMSVMLGQWRSDVPTLVSAWRLRKIRD